MHKINISLSTGLFIAMSALQCQKMDSYDSELNNAAEQCGGTAATLQEELLRSQEGLDSLAIHLKNLPVGIPKKAEKLTYQRNLRWKFSIQKSADSLAAFQINCSDWQTKKVHLKATALLHDLIELNNDIEACEYSISVIKTGK
ncbi:MAG: hypothetical protein RLZZ500_535 [Bacteroidota bacterium]|jgi:hypothetical protein